MLTRQILSLKILFDYSGIVKFKYTYREVINMKKSPLDDPEFVHREMRRTVAELFNARSVRRIKFLQRKLKFLEKRLAEITNNS